MILAAVIAAALCALGALLASRRRAVSVRTPPISRSEVIDDALTAERLRRQALAVHRIEQRRGLARPVRDSDMYRIAGEALTHRPEEMGVLVSDLSTMEIVASDGAIERILGMEPGAFEGRVWLDLIDPEDLPRMARDTEDLDGEGTYRYRRADGTGWCPIYFSWHIDYDRGVSVCYLRDATMRVASERLRDTMRTIESWGPRSIVGAD